MIRRRVCVPGAHRAADGSVLLPLVAAMLVLSLCGAALTELFTTQRYESVLETDSARAYWIAEAGLWHVGHVGTELPVPVPYAAGTYVVRKSGDVYTAAGTYGGATRVAVREFTGTLDGPLDEAASAATATRNGNRRFRIDLVNPTGTDLVIESFSLVSDVGNEELHRLRLQDRRIWHDHGVFLPTGTQALNEGTTADRTIPAGSRLTRSGARPAPCDTPTSCRWRPWPPAWAARPPHRSSRSAWRAGDSSSCATTRAR